MGRLGIHGDCVYKEESLGLASNKCHTDKLRQVSEREQELLTSFQGEHLLVFQELAVRSERTFIQLHPPYQLKDWEALLSLLCILTSISSY